jgi:hypothetical protein
MDPLSYKAERSDTRVYPAEVSDTAVHLPSTDDVEETANCEAEPTGFASAAEVYATLRLHDAHGCRRYWAAHAYISADPDE